MKKQSMKTEKPQGVGLTARVATISIGDIQPSPYNVHGPEKDSDAFSALVRSVGRYGLIHRIAVRETEEGSHKFVIVDGHRRFNACKKAGMKDIPCEVWDIPEDEAMAVTVSANSHRIENDPILEAEYIERMRKLGHSFAEISRMLCRPESSVTIRARLITLTEEWRKFAKQHPCTIEMLERVAAHEPMLQKEVAAFLGIDEYGDPDGSAYEWSEFSSEFSSHLYKIADAKFDTAECANCPFNTATHKFLFPDLEDDKDECCCQKAACYVEKANRETDAIIARLRANGTPAIEISGRYYAPWPHDERKTSKTPQAYVYAEGQLRKIVWAAKREERAKVAKTAEEKAAEKAHRQYEKNLRAAYHRIRQDGFVNARSENIESAVSALVRTDAFTKFSEEKLKKQLTSISSYGDCIIHDLVEMCGGVDEFVRRFPVSLEDAELEALKRSAEPQPEED